MHFAAHPRDDGSPESAYMRRSRGRTMDAVRALLVAGADSNATSFDDARWTSDDRGETPLHYVARRHGDHIEIVRALLDAQADPKARDSRGMTPLHYAAQRGHGEIVQALLDAGVHVRFLRF